LVKELAVKVVPDEWQCGHRHFQLPAAHRRAQFCADGGVFGLRVADADGMRNARPEAAAGDFADGRAAGEQLRAGALKFTLAVIQC